MNADLMILHSESGAKSSNRHFLPSPIFGSGDGGEGILKFIEYLDGLAGLDRLPGGYADSH